MSSQDYKIQLSIKTPHGTLINLPVNSYEEAVAALSTVRELAGDVISTEQILAGAGAAAPLVEVPPTEVAAPVSVGGGAPPAYNPPAPATNGPPSCPHGPRTFRTGDGAKGPWAAYFCSLPKGDSRQCPPEWDRSYGK